MQQEEILKSLNDFEHMIQKNFSEDAVESIETEGLRRSFRGLKNNAIKEIVEDIEHAKSVISSPIYVGLLGRYSHGKSALVNALFKLDDDCRLPEGEGVVTSKVTLVDFDDYPTAQAFAIVSNEELPRQISINELIGSVGSNNDDESICVESYKLTLPTSGRGFASNFLANNITLVDMPGLGGPYFTDKVTTANYLKYMDMALVVMKVDEIEDSARHIRYFVENLNIPVVPILTYQDLWKKSDLYMDCDDEAAMLAKAQSLIEEHLPSLKKYCVNLIAVSSIKDENGSEHKNIASLRGIILDQITNKKLAIGKARTEIAPIYKKQVMELSKEFGALKIKLDKLLADINKEFNQWLPNSKDILSFEETLNKNVRIKRAKDRFIAEAKRVISDCTREYRERVNEMRSLSSYNDLKNLVDKFEDSVTDRFAIHKSRMSDLNKEYLTVLGEQVQGIIEQMQFDRQTKKDLSNRVENVLETSHFEWDCQYRNESKVQDDISNAIRTYSANTTINYFSELIKNPTNLLLVGIGLGILIIFPGIPLLKKISLCGLIPLVIAAINVYQAIPTQRRNELNNLKNSLIDALQGGFNEVKWKEYVEETILKYIGEVYEDLESDMSSETDLYNRDTKEFLRIKDEIEDGKEELSVKIEEELQGLKANVR